MGGSGVWTSAASAVAPWFALLISSFSLWYSRTAIKLTREQEARKRPLLVLYFRDGFFRRGADGKGRVYAFLLSISNRSDSDNAIAELDLHISYTTPSGSHLTLKVRSEANAGGIDDSLQKPYLLVPQRLDAHQTVLGWCFFSVNESLLERLDRVDKYLISALDSHGVEATVEPVLIARDRHDEYSEKEKDHNNK